jgi:hypothetical protein
MIVQLSVSGILVRDTGARFENVAIWVGVLPGVDDDDDDEDGDCEMTMMARMTKR